MLRGTDATARRSYNYPRLNDSYDRGVDNSFTGLDIDRRYAAEVRQQRLGDSFQLISLFIAARESHNDLLHTTGRILFRSLVGSLNSEEVPNK